MPDFSRVDPELLRQLDEARDSDVPVAAAVSVRRKQGVPPDPAKIDANLKTAMARAKRMTDTEPSRVQVMPHIAIAYVEAPGRLIRALIDQPEVTGAVAGRPEEEMSPEEKAASGDIEPPTKSDTSTDGSQSHGAKTSEAGTA
jgi:hypothetical protein